MSDLEKTEHPTPKRIEKAREEGNVLKSKELSIFIILMAGFLGFWALSGWFKNGVENIFKKYLTIDVFAARNASAMTDRLGNIFLDALILLSPIFVILTVACFITPAIFKSFIFSQKALIPKLERLNPMEGIKRIFSIASLVELLKAILKTILLGGVGVLLLWISKEEMLQLNVEDVYSAIAHASNMVILYTVIVTAILLVVVAIDVPFQMWNYYDKLKMTIDEVKREFKESEGNPFVKSRRRQIAMQNARGNMVSAVPESSVIVTNPTHYAIALKYKEGMNAPVVVAMGVDNIAKKIREVAKENKIKIIEAPPLARALYKHSELDQEIPSVFYKSVAEVLSYVYKLNNWEQTGGQYPLPPEEFLTSKFDLNN